MRLRLLYSVLYGLPLLAFAQFRSAWDYAIFRDAHGYSYIETYITLNAARWPIKNNTQTVYISGALRSVDTAISFSYQVHHVKQNPGLNFIDVQRYFLKPGKYHIHLHIAESKQFGAFADTFEDSITVLKSAPIGLSDIECIEHFEKSNQKHPLQKFGVKLIPYSSNIYNEKHTQLQVYQECYFSMTQDTGTYFLYRYFISDAENGKPITGLSGFKKIKGAFIYPQLIQLPISKLQSGRYVITCQLVSTENVILAQSQKIFIKEGHGHEKTIPEALFFGSTQHSDTIKMLLESLWPIAGELQKNQIINQALRNDVKLMKQYIVQFWQDRCADTANPVKSWALHYQKVQSAIALFKCGKQPAYYTDRGRVYIQYGPPNQRTQQNNEENTYPYEIWQYYRIYDATNGQFFSNRKFVFVNQMLGDDYFKLIHSDMRGEINNPRWQFEITRRNSNGLFNPDNTTPAGTENNQFRDLFNNPR